MTRRRWLRRAAAGVGVLVGATRRLAHGLSAVGGLLPASARGAELPLTSAELDTLLAFGEAVVDGRALSAEVRATLTDALAEAVARAPDRITLYRGAARLLDHLAGRELARLSLVDRAALVSRNRLDIRAASNEPGLTDDARFIRTTLAPELIVAYWGSAAGWAAVGYGAFPGRCGDLARYTRAEP